MSNQVKNIFVAIIIIALVIFSIYFLLQRGNRIEANQFTGNLINIEGDTLTLDGVYLNNGKVVESQSSKEVRVKVTDSTLIERETFEVPNTKEPFYPDKLVKGKTPVPFSVVLEDSISNTLGFVVEADSNIFNKSEFTASKITYRVPIFSKK